MNEKWDKRFLELSAHVSWWSKDPSTKCGAVIVDDKNRIISVGYNGFPRGMIDDLSIDREEKLSKTVHCEMNAILFANQSLEGCTLYTHPFLSCDRCAVHVIQSGITRVVAYSLPQRLQARWGGSVKRALLYYHEAGVYTTIYPPRELPLTTTSSTQINQLPRKPLKPTHHYTKPVSSPQPSIYPDDWPTEE